MQRIHVSTVLGNYIRTGTCYMVHGRHTCCREDKNNVFFLIFFFVIYSVASIQNDHKSIQYVVVVCTWSVDKIREPRRMGRGEKPICRIVIGFRWDWESNKFYERLSSIRADPLLYIHTSCGSDHATQRLYNWIFRT